MPTFELEVPLALTLQRLLGPAIGVVLFFWALSAWDHTRRLPPGPTRFEQYWGGGQPKGTPFWIWAAQLSIRYKSPIIYLRRGGQSTVVLNTPQACREILSLESVSSRPASVVGGLFGGGYRLSLMDNDERWKLHRKLLHRSFNATVAQTYYPTHESESLYLLDNLMRSPNDYTAHCQSYIANIMMRTSYGTGHVDLEADPAYRLLRRAVDLTSLYATSDNFAVERFSWLRFLPLPLAPWKAKALRHSEDVRQGYRDLLDSVRARLKAGDCPPCFARDLLELGTEETISEDELATLVAVPFGNGSDTTAGILRVFILACCASHDTFYARALAEIDKVVPEERLPTFDDLEKMPFVQAICKEIQRWKTSTAIALPHAASEDVEYNGLLIPRGAAVIGNTYASHHDKRFFPDPHGFKPQRFLEEFVPGFPNSLGHSSFGYGRRACAGLNLAQDALIIAVARLLWAFEIRSPSGSPAIDLSSAGFIEHGETNVAKPFAAMFQLRSDKRGDVIRKELGPVSSAGT